MNLPPCAFRLDAPQTLTMSFLALLSPTLVILTGLLHLDLQLQPTLPQPLFGVRNWIVEILLLLQCPAEWVGHFNSNIRASALHGAASPTLAAKSPIYQAAT